MDHAPRVFEILKKSGLKSPLGICLVAVFLAVLSAQIPFSSRALAGETNKYETALTPLVESTLSSRISGYVKSIDVAEGQAFEKDASLVEVDCDLYKADLDRTNAELKGARETYAARQKLDKLKSISKLDVTLSGIEIEKLDADKLRKEKLVENCIIKAPFAGVVTELQAKPFQNVNEGEPLLKIISIESVQLEFFVPSSDIARFKPDMALNLYINETSQNYKAALVSVIPRIDPVSQTFKVIGRLDNPDKSLLPGMSGYVTLPGDKTEPSNTPTAETPAPSQP